MDRCRLIFRGEIRTGFEPQEVRDAVQSLLRCNDSTLRRIFSGRPVQLKGDLDLSSARKYKALFEKTGAICHINPHARLESKPPEAGNTSTEPQMTCPACGFDQAQAQSCLRCGIVIKKFLQRQSNVEIASEEHPDEAEGETCGSRKGVPDRDQSTAAFLRELLLPSDDSGDPLFVGIKALLLLGLLVWGSRFAFSSIVGNYAGESFMHLINTPFHEAGHVLFRPFGRFMTSLGGSLSQILFPLICLLALLLKNRDPFGGAVCLWWTGQNFIDMAPYINDARAGVLPLLGGNTGQSSPYGFHDWEFILTESGLLRLDHTLARLTHIFGAAVMALAIIWGVAVLYRQFRAGRAESPPPAANSDQQPKIRF